MKDLCPECETMHKINETCPPREPWQETGQRCGWTDTGVCQAKIAKACKWPHCRKG